MLPSVKGNVPDGAVLLSTTISLIGQAVNDDWMVTAYEMITWTRPALPSAAGEFVLSAIPDSIPEGYGLVSVLPIQGKGYNVVSR